MDSVSVAVPPPGHTKGPSLTSNVSADGDFDERRGKIRQWIEDIDAIDNVTSRSSMAGTELNSVISSEDSRAGRMPDHLTLRGSDSDTTQSRLAGPDSILHEDEGDSEDDFFVEAAQQALQKGKDAFGADDYSGAIAYLREALTMIKGLSTKQQATCDTWELRRMLGICAFHVKEPSDAEAALLSYLENAPKNAILNETQRLQVSETAHLLAQTYVKLGNLEKAYRYCEFSLRGRRRVLGKAHHKSYESLALMARILELQENNLRAEFFVGMIPETERSVYTKQFEGLLIPDLPPQINAPVTPTEKSSGGTIEQVGNSSPPEVPERKRPRPISGLSGNVSSVTSDAGRNSTVSSLSPPGSPEIRLSRNLSPAMEHPAFRNQGQGQPRSVSAHPVPVYQQPTNDRPPVQRTPSDLPYRPYMPVVNESSDTLQTQGSHTLYPQPLRLQRPINVSELPGDMSYHAVQHQAPPTPPSSLPAAEEKIAITFQPYTPPTLLHPANRDSVANSSSDGRPYTPSVYSQSSGEPQPVRPSIESSLNRPSMGPTVRPSLESSLNRSSSDQANRRKSSSVLKMFRTKSSASGASDTSDSSFHYNTVRLNRKDYDCLKSEHLTDNAVDFWQEYLEHEMVKGNPKFTLLRPLRTHLLLQQNSDPATLKAALPDFQYTMHVFIPLRAPGKDHWSLLLVSAQDGLACHYDPTPNRNNRLAAEVTSRISNYLEKHLTFLEVPDTPEQSKAVDSGVYICVFMQHLITKLLQTHVSQKVDATLQCKAIESKAARKAMVKAVEENTKVKATMSGGGGGGGEKEKERGKTSSSLNRAFAYSSVGTI